jgi:hypothetical protein
MVQGKIEILDDKALLQQLRNLTEERSERGQIDVRPSSGKDDQTVALALATSEIVKWRPPDIFDSVPVNPRFSRYVCKIPRTASMRRVADIIRDA